MTIETSCRAEMWWGAGEAIQITNLPRRAGGRWGLCRLLFLTSASRRRAGFILQDSERAPMGDLSFSDVECQLRHASALEGGYRDVAPGGVAPGLIRSKMRQICGVGEILWWVIRVV